MRLGPVRLLLLLIVLLAAGLAWLWVDQHGQWRNLAWTAPKAILPELKVPFGEVQANAPAPAQFASLLERPLFAPDRRPPPPPPPPAPPVAAPPPDPLANIQIQGIFSGENAGILARVDGKVRRIKLNEAVGPWTLKSVDGRDVTFGQGEENRKLRLDYARLDTVAPKAAAPAPADGAPASPAAGVAGLPQNLQDEARERLRRRNEIRAARGLPLVTQ